MQIDRSRKFFLQTVAWKTKLAVAEHRSTTLCSASSSRQAREQASCHTAVRAVVAHMSAVDLLQLGVCSSRQLSACRS